jgi:hypothetical protein
MQGIVEQAAGAGVKTEAQAGAQVVKEMAKETAQAAAEKGVKAATKEAAQAVVENEAVALAKHLKKPNVFVNKPPVKINHPVINSMRTGSGLKKDIHHSFNNIIDNYAQYAKKTILKGDDELLRELYQIKGSLNGQAGIFEWIVDPRPEKGVTHRFFVKNGTITGLANIFVRSKK